MPMRTKAGWSQNFSLFIVIASTALLLLRLWRWAHGHGHWDDLLTSSALLLLALPQALRIEGVPKYVVQFLGLGVMIVAIVMLSRSLGP